MSEFIGSRISLISKSDIRYVGTLHEINSESSTVALEQVTSYGTEGRRGDPAEEVVASNELYEYIVFRGSDVKDLRIEEAPKENKPPPPQVPNDPAILGSGTRPPTQHPTQHQPQGPRQDQPPHFQQPPPFPYQPYGQYPQQRFGVPPGPPAQGFRGPPGGYGYQGMPYGVPPPGWYPPPGQGFPPAPGQFPPHHQMPPYGGPGPQPGQQLQGGLPKDASPQAVEVEATTPSVQKPAVNLPVASAKAQNPKSSSTTTAPQTPVGAPPPPPVESKPDVAAALAPPAPTQASSGPKNVPSGPKSGRIIPAIPFASPGARPSPTPATNTLAPSKQASVTENIQSSSAQAGQAAANAALQYQNAAQAATAAVAAAMAKLPPMGGQALKQLGEGDAIDNLTRKVNEMRTDDRARHPRQPANGPYVGGHRGARGGRGRGGREPQGKPLEVPTTDFDFESANAQFNKQDLVKQAIASGSPSATPVESGSAQTPNGESVTDGAADVVIPGLGAGMYNKSSFFDNISSEAKDREETADGKQGGYEFRNEERRKNMETFGLGSVDGGYRGGFRGRGRARGNFRGGYGRGGGQRGGVRGGRGESDGAVAAAQFAGGV